MATSRGREAKPRFIICKALRIERKIPSIWNPLCERVAGVCSSLDNHVLLIRFNTFHLFLTLTAQKKCRSGTYIAPFSVIRPLMCPALCQALQGGTRKLVPSRWFIIEISPFHLTGVT